ncbi:MAG: type II toxin-antitoxin system death-on-curing family toxin [Crocosphaera sp.]|nr:type II toxin-antitoxin system death-on-curing family toxin [Crocosphaera sp.]
MTNIRWISEKIVRAIQKDLVLQYGGIPGIRDDNLLSASLARPRHLSTYENPSIYELAAAYGYGITKKHPFVDGNKRTAFMVMYTFLGLNCYQLNAPEKEVVIIMEQLASGEIEQASLAEWLEVYTENKA